MQTIMSHNVAYSKGVQKSIQFYLHLLFLFPSVPSSLLGLDNSSSSFKHSTSVTSSEKPFYDSVGEESSPVSFYNIPFLSDHTTPHLLLLYNSCLAYLFSNVCSEKFLF